MNLGGGRKTDLNLDTQYIRNSAVITLVKYMNIWKKQGAVKYTKEHRYRRELNSSPTFFPSRWVALGHQVINP